MTSSSSYNYASNSLYGSQGKYEVFLSFKIEDTWRTFTGYLYQQLKNKGILSTFQDNMPLEDGDSIPEELLKTIKESQCTLVVFSKMKIMESKDEYVQTVIPAFYDVDPSEVQKQMESFAEAFDKYESNYKDDVEGMQKSFCGQTDRVPSLSFKAATSSGDLREESYYALGVAEIGLLLA
ncbi:hypothetical protein H5410_035593 [Solanum commersonii]|uniref:TIR domain-containing protein n=1 Tax=Solanum commersonii TaxID=4109 RepID=A0A9J5Y1P9_SOLCO|nr:hypothetical protein H5410_035593 [Solanum commersonii]